MYPKFGIGYLQVYICKQNMEQRQNMKKRKGDGGISILHEMNEYVSSYSTDCTVVQRASLEVEALP